MADTKTSDESAAATLTGAELVRVVQSAADKKTTAKAIALTYWSFAASAPSSPSPGQKWTDSTSGIEYTWVDDGTSTQWVEL